MSKEIERKFLIKISEAEIAELALGSVSITQAYFTVDPERTVRIRIKDDKVYLTIKGLSDKSGLSRDEFEEEIHPEDPSALLALALPGRIEKTRYHIYWESFLIEVDVFHGDNAGLILAEVEFESEEAAQAFQAPAWFGKEVTGILDFYNSKLLSCPYSKWIEEDKSGE